jgi:hypothetical protein
MKNILIIDNKSKHTKEISKLFHGQKISFCLYDKIPDTQKFDLIVLSWGSHYSVLQKTISLHQRNGIDQKHKDPSIVNMSLMSVNSSCLRLESDQDAREVSERDWD